MVNKYEVTKYFIYKFDIWHNDYFKYVYKHTNKIRESNGLSILSILSLIGIAMTIKRNKEYYLVKNVYEDISMRAIGIFDKDIYNFLINSDFSNYTDSDMNKIGYIDLSPDVMIILDDIIEKLKSRYSNVIILSPFEILKEMRGHKLFNDYYVIDKLGEEYRYKHEIINHDMFIDSLG